MEQRHQKSPEGKTNWVSAHWRGKHNLAKSLIINILAFPAAIGTIVVTTELAIHRIVDSAAKGYIPAIYLEAGLTVYDKYIEFAMLLFISIVFIWSLVRSWRSNTNLFCHRGKYCIIFSRVILIVVFLLYYSTSVNIMYPCLKFQIKIRNNISVCDQ